MCWTTFMSDMRSDSFTSALNGKIASVELIYNGFILEGLGIKLSDLSSNDTTQHSVWWKRKGDSLEAAGYTRPDFE